jgi:hypothetical protein
MSEIAPAAPTTDTTSETPAADQRPTSEVPAEGQQIPAWKPPKLRVYGKEVELDEATYHKHAQTGAAFAEQTRRLAAERAELERQREAYANAVPVDRLKSDPAAVFKELGIDPLKWSADQLVKTHEAETLPPEQKALQEREAAIAAKEKEFQEREQRAQQEQLQAATQARRADLGQRFVQALTAAGVPEGPASWPFLEKMVAHQTDLDALVQEYHRTNGAGGVSPEEAAQRGTPEALAELAREEVMAKDAATWGKLSGDDLLYAIPREVGDRYLEARVLEHQKRHQSGAPAPLVPRTAPIGAGVQPPRPQQAAPRQNGVPHDPTNGKFTTREHREFIDRLGLGGG